MAILYKHMDSDAVMSLYQKGYTDAEIANICKISREPIRKWRVKNGLPTNSKRKGTGCAGCLYWLNSSGCDYGIHDRFCHHLLHTNKRRVIGENGECLSYTKRGGS